MKLQSKINDVKSEFYSGKCVIEFEKDDLEIIDFDGVLTTSNVKPIEGESVKITGKFTRPINPKSYKIQWYLNSEKVEKSMRFVISSSSNELESSFEIKPLKGSDEGALIEIALISVKENSEVKRSGLQLERAIRYV